MIKFEGEVGFMDSGVNVSIIIATYNPDFDKLLTSIKAAINQKKISFEIIITDDGSKEDHFQTVKKFFDNIGFKNYQLIKNKTNVGTVKNILNAVLVAKGEYVFLNSPGDYIFDENAMADFYYFAKEKKADICFGDYIPYHRQNGENIFVDFVGPKNVEIYNRGIKDYSLCFLIGCGILGASYFRSKAFLIEALEFVFNYAKYTEDTTTTAYALLNNVEVLYYSRKIAWYEFGSGISTQGSGKWDQIIRKELIDTYSALLNLYPKARYLKAAIFFEENIGDVNWKFKFLIRFPIISLKRIIFKKMPERKLNANEDEALALSNLQDLQSEKKLIE